MNGWGPFLFACSLTAAGVVLAAWLFYRAFWPEGNR